MQMTYRSPNGQFEVTFNGEKQSDLFEEIASFQEVFETPEVKIKGVVVPQEHIQFRVRTVDDNKYFEKVYVGPNPELWGFKLPYGQNKKGGGLFPKHRLEDADRANYEDGKNGWRKWKGDNAGQTQQATPSNGPGF